MMNKIDKYILHYKSLINLGLPIVIGQLGIIILGFADTMMIGKHSTDELAAASFVNNIFNLVIIFSVGFSYGSTPVISMLFSQGKKQRAGYALKVSIIANIILAMLLCSILLVVYLNLDDFKQPEEIVPIMRPYFISLLISIPFVLVFNALRQFTDGITKTKVAMWILLIGNGLNILGNYILIYGKFGMPELGLLGAGISTLLSRVFMIVVYFSLFFSSNSFIEYRLGFVREKFTLSFYKKINKLGIPISLQMGMETASFSLSTFMVGWIGTIALASHQVMLTVSQFTFMVYYGIGSAISVSVSHYLGKRDIIGVQRVAYAGFHLMIIICFFQSVFIFLMKEYIPYWFTDDVDVVNLSITLVLPFLLYQLGDTLQITFSNALRGISDVKPMMYIAFLSYFIISLPLGYCFAFIFGLDLQGIWLAFPFGLTSAGLLFLLRFRSQIKQYLSCR